MGSSHSEVRFVGLDGLRGVAALLVVFSHIHNRGAEIVPFFSFGGSGKMGVWLFFLLSSFLLSFQIINAPRKRIRTGRYWLRYLISRVFRIWPLYVVALLAAYGITASGVWQNGEGLPNTITGKDIFEALTLQRAAGIFWTIPVEFKFYLILPFLILIVRYFSRWSPWGAIAFLFTLIVLSFSLLPVYLDGSSPTQFGGIFLSGSFLAALWSQDSVRNFVKSRPRLFGGVGWFSIAILLLTMPKMWFKFSPFWSEVNTQEWQWLTTSLWALLIVCVISESNRLARFFSHSALKFCGAVSYSLYLLHYVALKPLITLGWSPLLTGWLALALALFLAFLSYRFLEMPFMGLAKQLKTRVQ